MKDHYSRQILLEPPNSQLDVPPQEKQKKTSPTRQFTTLIIGWILRGGVILSASIILLGLLLLLSHPGGLSQQQYFPHTLRQVEIGLLTLQPQAVIALGLLLLIATPVATVSASVVSFALEHDRPYVVIALIVLATLITSFLLGKGGG